MKLKAQKTIHASAETIFAYFVLPHLIREWQSGLMSLYAESGVTEADKVAVGDVYHYTVGKELYQAKVLEVEYPHKLKIHHRSKKSSFTDTVSLKSINPSVTKVKMHSSKSALKYYLASLLVMLIDVIAPGESTGNNEKEVSFDQLNALDRAVSARSL